MSLFESGSAASSKEEAGLKATASEESEEGWNKHQQEIFTWTGQAAQGAAENPHAQIRARAGTGKTTTALEMADIIAEENPAADALFVTFSRGISKEIGRKLNTSAFEARTIHSVGYEAIRKHTTPRQGQFEVEKWKYLDLVDDWASENYSGYRSGNWYQVKWDIFNLLDLCRNLQADPENEEELKEVANRTGVALGPWSDGIEDMLARGREAVRMFGTLDYTDMVSYVVEAGVQLSKYDWVIIDEAQDLNPAQKEIADRLIAQDGHSVWIGDEHQAIYQFQGARPGEFLEIPSQYDTETFTLPISYRCPTSHVREANRIVSDIEAAPDAPKGTFERTDKKEFYEKVRPGDVVISRRNAPIIRHAVGLVAQKRAARIEGRNLENQLSSIINKVADRMLEDSMLEEGGRKRIGEDLAGKERPQDWIIDYSRFPQATEKWAEEKILNLQNQGAGEEAIAVVADKKECVLAAYEGFEEATCPAELKSEIAQLFEQDNGISFTTIHKAKGKEFERLHIIDPDSLPIEFDGIRPPGEINVKYVCMTRSTQYLNVFGDLWSERDEVSIGDPLPGEDLDAEEATKKLKEKVAQILQKASSTTFEAEAEAFRKKAEEIMDEWDLTRSGLKEEGFKVEA